MKVEIPMRDVVGGLTLRLVLTGTRRARARMWLGSRLLLLGAVVTGCNVDIVDSSNAATVEG